MAEETVTTQTVDAGTTQGATSTGAPPPTFRDMVAAELREQSKDQVGTAANSDDTSAEQTAEQTQQAGDQTVEAADTEDALLTPEEVAKLSGKELDLYKKAQKNYTIKTQGLAAERKKLEPFRDLIDALQDPDRAKDTVMQLAQHVGLVSKAEEKKIEAAADGLLNGLPAELSFLRPHLEEFGKQLLAQFQSEIAPLKSQTQEIVTKTMAEATTATLSAFGKEYPGWEKYEPQMIEIGKSVQPSGNMSEMDYLKMLYKLATYDVQSAEKTKQIVEGMTKAAKAAEPSSTSSAVQSERVVYAKPANIAQMSSRERFLAGHEAAKRGQKWE